MSIRSFTSALAIGAVCMLSIAGCAKPASSTDVASLSGAGADGDSATATTTHKQSPEEVTEAFRKFAECMREHGVDMQDPKVGEGGGVMIGGPGQKDPDPSKLEPAQKECQPLIKDVIDNGPGKLDPEQEAKMREQSLNFSKCMREHGVDMPDPTFEDGGRMTMQLKGDPESATFKDAQNACKEFMAGAPGGGGPGFGVQSKGPDGGGDDVQKGTDGPSAQIGGGQ